MQRLFKIQIYNKNNTWQDMYPTPYKPSTNISLWPIGLLLESRVDMGCDTNVAMYHSLCIV